VTGIKALIYHTAKKTEKTYRYITQSLHAVPSSKGRRKAPASPCLGDTGGDPPYAAASPSSLSLPSRRHRSELPATPRSREDDGDGDFSLLLLGAGAPPAAARFVTGHRRPSAAAGARICGLGGRIRQGQGWIWRGGGGDGPFRRSV